MKMLFCCTTEFQLLTALNIKYHMHPDDEADIIVDNYHGEEKELADRIRETGLFRKVFYVKSWIEQETLHRYFKEVIAGEKNLKLLWAVKNSLRFAGIKCLQSLLGAKYYIRHMIVNASKLEIEEYGALLVYGTKPITKNLLAYLSSANEYCRIMLMDEGFGHATLGNYSLSEIFQTIEKCYTYSNVTMQILPEGKICKIPAIKKSESEFISILNYVFDFHLEDIEDYSNSVIYFNPNGGEARMPQYFNRFWLAKILLPRLYKKHLIEEKNYCNLLALTNFIISYFKERKFDKELWIKIAPRSSRDFFDEYKGRTDIRLMKRWDMPWELLALNCSLDNSILLTDWSVAACLCREVVNPLGDNVHRILLYRIMKYELSEFEERLFHYLEIQNEDLHIPRNKSELDNVVSIIVNEG